jgi:hypothetical protein
VTSLWPDASPLRGPGARGFRAVFLSRTVVYLGSQAAEVALLVQAQRLTGSPLVVGTLGLAELVPLLVFGLYGGVLADRFDRRALMRWCEPPLLLCACLLLVNALLPHPLLWPLYALAAVMMALTSLQRPAFEAATPHIVPGSLLTSAAAILSLVWFALFFLAVAGGADECSGVFRDTMWKQSIPDHLRGRLAGVELLSYGAGPPTGQLRSGVVAALTGPRFSLTSGGLACVGAVGAVCVALPSFVRYTAPSAAVLADADEHRLYG